VLVVMHDPLAPAGLVGLTAVELGGRTTVFMPHESYGSERPDEVVALPADEHGFDALLILGGAMHAGDDDGFPHFRALLDLIRRFHGVDKPVLGICLGAQLIGRAFGAPVRRLGFLEIGFHEVALSEAAIHDPLLHGLGPGFMAMQWHEDTVGLPEGAVHLGSSRECANQIFRVGRATYGFQAHIEVSPDIVRSWVRLRAAMLADRDPAFFGRLERDLGLHMRDAIQLCRLLTGRWLELARSPAE
jgi:GMP synthase (glutamine-hydrolysing)